MFDILKSLGPGDIIDIAIVTFLIGWLGLPAEITVVAIGLAITMLSVILMIQFSKRYPLPDAELSNAS